jgi:hypothetical protein
MRAFCFLSDLMLFVLFLCLGTAVSPSPQPPTIVTPAGTYTDVVSVSVSVGVPTDVLYYSTNPIAPLSFYNVFPASAPIKITVYYEFFATSGTILNPGNATLFVFSLRSGYGPSAVVNRTFTIFQNMTIASPVISVVNGAGTATISIAKIDPSDLVQTRYLLDDSSPFSYTTQQVTGDILITTPGTHTIRAVNTKMFPSTLTNMTAVVSTTFVVSQTAPPTVSPADGTYYNSVQPTITCGVQGCTLFYTLDGSIPVITFSGTVASAGNAATHLYSTSITLAPGSRMLNVKAAFQGYASANVLTMYEVVQVLSPPILTPPNGTLQLAQASVSIVSREAANIWYIIRPRPDPNAAPSVFPNAEWILLLVPNITLTSNSTVYVVVDKLYSKAVVNVTISTYNVIAPAIVYIPPDAPFNYTVLLAILAIIPIAVLIGLAYWYKKNRQREAIENAVFQKHDFDFSPKG